MTDTLTDQMDCTPILSVKVSVKKIKGTAHKNGEVYSTCKWSFTSRDFLTYVSLHYN